MSRFERSEENSKHEETYEVFSSIPHMCEVKSKKITVSPGGSEFIKLCLKAPASEIIAEIKLLIRNSKTKEPEEVIQFDLNIWESIV